MCQVSWHFKLKSVCDWFILSTFSIKLSYHMELTFSFQASVSGTGKFSWSKSRSSDLGFPSFPKDPPWLDSTKLQKGGKKNKWKKWYRKKGNLATRHTWKSPHLLCLSSQPLAYPARLLQPDPYPPLCSLTAAIRYNKNE